MQQLDDDMDELFREAANRYPLKTGGQDWNVVLSRLQQPEEPASVSAAQHRNRRNWFLWMLVLAPLAFIAHLPVPEQLSSRTVPPTIATAVTSGPAQQNIDPSGNTTIRKPSRVITEPENRLSIHDKTRIIARPQRALKDDQPPVTTGNTITAVATAGSNIIDSTTAPPSLTDSLPVVVSNKPDAQQHQLDSSDGNIDSGKPESFRKGWYVGFIASPDISVVKWQQAGKTGYGAGLLIGYRLSKRFSVETGVLWEQKHYVSSGRYLDNKKIPANWNITDVDGWCRMFELPLQLRYHFSIQKKSNWYLNAGLSSYIMNRENYNYSYYRNNNLVSRNATYDNETRNWFSVAHTGIGYERTLGAVGNIRIEPFIKTPLSGLGWGGLPITSLGLNIGITKTLR